MSFTDAVASRFAFWIINEKSPPDEAAVQQLREERRLHLLKQKFSIGVTASLGGGMVLIAPDWALVIVLIVLLLLAPKVWELRRDTLATAVLFDPADSVEGLPAEIDRARERSPRVEQYYQQVQRAGRPVLRVEAVAMAAVPDLPEADWKE